MIIYKTTNLINGKFYIGKDSFNDPEYLGSGKLIKSAIKKYGRGNFKKEIIEYCDDIDHLNDREKYWISELKCRESLNCYNIGEGGIGGDNITFNPNKDEFIQKMKRINSESNGMFGKNHKPESKQKQKDKAVGRYTLPWFINRYGLEEGTTKYESRNIRRTECMSGNVNPAYLHVDKNELEQFIIENSKCKLIELVERFNVGTTCLYGKFKIYYQAKNLKEVKKILGIL